ncbi:MAG: hypothetical protein HUU54_01260 [Ignavibacteriaceae bacterium]|nr:hypothetical protein [Ignavibacteriaceae bacterium]
MNFSHYRLTAILLLILTLSIYSQNVSGVYATDFGKMTLHQNGNSVTGTYEHSSGKIEGTLNGTTLTGRWKQSNGSGKFIFNFKTDFSDFTGKWGYNEETPTGSWNGKRTGAPISTEKSKPVKEEPEVLNVSGVYISDFGDLLIKQSGQNITGTYPHSNGRIEGSLNGRTLSGRWYQDNGTGKLEFNFNEDATAFTGKWGYNEATPSGTWNGRKK